MMILAFMLPAIATAIPQDFDNYEFMVDGVYYKIVDGTAVVTFKGYYSSTYWGGYSGDVVIPTTVIHEGKTYPVNIIDHYAFIHCPGLTSITIPESITTIGSAFYDCGGLTRVNITDIEAWCKIDMHSNPLVYAHHLYLNGTEVTDLIIPESITKVGDFAFEGCSGLASVTIPNTVTSIGDNAFEGCSGLTSIIIPNSVTEIGSVAFEGCTGLRSVTLGNALTRIGTYAFSGCAGITSIKIPKTVTAIGANAFNGCSGLTSIDIPDLVTEIGGMAFYNCTGLTSVSIGKSVTSIGKDAFKNTPLIETVTCKATTPPSWYNTDMFTVNVFNHAPLHVPVGCERAYKADPNWGQFLTIIGDVTPEAYAVFTEADSTLTFFYDELRSTRSGTTYDLNTGANTPDWFENRYNVSHVVFDPSFAAARPTSTYLWFVEMINMPSVTGLEHLNTSDVTDMAGMFANCESLSTLDLSGFNTENVQNMERMFNGCRILTTLDLSSFNTSNVTRMCQMFSNCGALASLDLSGFNTSNVTTMSGMFHSCRSLVTLDLSGFNTSNVTDMGGMFSGCNHLETIFASNNWSTVALTYSDYMFYGCASLVGGQGTSYDENHVDAAYAHIDGGPSNPGYFTEKGISIPGDANGDGTVNISDANSVIDIVIMGGNGGHSRMPAADVNNDGLVNVTDLNFIINIIIRKE